MSKRRTWAGWPCRLAGILGVGFASISTVPAFADCPISSSAAFNLKSLKAADDKVRVGAASAMISEGVNTLPAIMGELKDFKGAPDQWPADKQLYFVSVTDIIRTIVSNNFPAIKRFRECDDSEIIMPLVAAAKSQNANMRVNATLILGNTVDNTTVCYVLHQLRDPQINVNGRANLLGVTLAVASYAYKENKKAIEDTLEIVERSVASKQSELSKTVKLISDIRSRVSTSANGREPLPQDLAIPCANYDYTWRSDRP